MARGIRTGALIGQLQGEAVALDDRGEWRTISFMNKRFTSLLVLLVLVLAPFGLYAESFDALLPLMVDLPGWEAEKADGAEVNASGVRAITAYRSYSNGERTFEATILIGMQAAAAWMPDYRDGFKTETPEGVMEVKKINGFLVFYVFEQEGASGGIIVLLQEAKSKADLQSVFSVTFKGLSREEALNTAQRFSWQKMKEQVALIK
jgi:hypothetical protein